MGGGVTIMTVVMVMVMVLAVPVFSMSKAGPSPAQCHREKELGVSACYSVLQGGDPSRECCRRVKVSHPKCICPEVTPTLIAAIGDVHRAIRLVKKCGRRVPRHFKCGCKYV